VLRACEGLDDDHRRATVPAHERWPDGADPGSYCAGFGGNIGRWVMQQLACDGDVALAVGIGEQAVLVLASGDEHPQIYVAQIDSSPNDYA
jgi:hypothetical protein